MSASLNLRRVAKRQRDRKRETARLDVEIERQVREYQIDYARTIYP